MSPVDNVQRLADYVAHIVDATRLARAYCVPLTQEQFAQDKKTQQAVMLNLMVIGEAVAKIGNTFPEFLHQHPEIPWKAIRGMRNRLAHGYFDVDLDTVWQTVQSALPSLEAALMQIQTKLP